MLSVVVLLFYLFGLLSGIDVYRYALVGTVYEILSIPLLAALVMMPILLILLWINGQKKERWMIILCLVMWIATLVVLTQPVLELYNRY